MAEALLTLAQARAAVAATVMALPTVEAGLEEALGRVLAHDVSAAGDVPGFANSAMDGFAVHSGAAGRRLRIVGESRAGAGTGAELGAGEAARISTGAPLPAGADSVVAVERTREEGDEVVLDADAPPGRNVREAGEDMHAGDVVLESGSLLGPAELSVAAAAGAGRLAVAQRPRVAVVATGDELVEPGERLAAGQIHDSNGLGIAALARAAGAEVVFRGRVGDDRERTRELLAEALEGCDVLVATGGVSVGAHDHVKPALGSLAVEETFWRVALKPGKPTWFGTRGTQLAFGLPGNPVSALVTFELFVEPALRALQGAPFHLPAGSARLAVPVARTRGREHAVRVALSHHDGVVHATPTGAQGSHRLTSMLGADGLAIVPPGEGELPAGTVVELLGVRSSAPPPT